jgi:hypothetical protein
MMKLRGIVGDMVTGLVLVYVVFFVLCGVYSGAGAGG